MKEKYNIGDEVWFTEGCNVGHGIVVEVHTHQWLYRPQEEYNADNVIRRSKYTVSGLYDNGTRSGVTHPNLQFLYDSKEEAEKSFNL